MIKNILVPMGSSPFSQNALLAAVEIGKLTKANLNLLFIEDISKMKEVLFASLAAGGVSLDLPASAGAQDEIARIHEEIDKERAEVQKFYDQVKDTVEGSHRFSAREGEVAPEILKEARISDMIVMAKVLKKSADDCTILPSAIMHIVQKAPVPIMAVCENMRLGEHVLLAYDGSHSSNNALRFIGNFVPSPVKKVTVLTVKRKEEDARPILDEAEQYLLSCGVTVEKLWKKDEHVKDAIVETAKSLNVSAIFIGGYGDNRVKELLAGSTTELILKAVTIPVILCNQ